MEADEEHAEEEYELVFSPLCQSITVDGHTLDIQIYRGLGPEWNLEVVEPSGGSNVWDDLFPTDLAALEEALRTIREDGAQSLLGLMDDPLPI
jgi:hypothetical protein